MDPALQPFQTAAATLAPGNPVSSYIGRVTAAPGWWFNYYSSVFQITNSNTWFPEGSETNTPSATYTNGKMTYDVMFLVVNYPSPNTYVTSASQKIAAEIVANSPAVFQQNWPIFYITAWGQGFITIGPPLDAIPLLTQRLKAADLITSITDTLLDTSSATMNLADMASCFPAQTYFGFQLNPITPTSSNDLLNGALGPAATRTTTGNSSLDANSWYYLPYQGTLSGYAVQATITYCKGAACVFGIASYAYALLTVSLVPELSTMLGSPPPLLTVLGCNQTSSAYNSVEVTNIINYGYNTPVATVLTVPSGSGTYTFPLCSPLKTKLGCVRCGKRQKADRRK